MRRERREEPDSDQDGGSDRGKFPRKQSGEPPLAGASNQDIKIEPLGMAEKAW